MQQVCRYGCKNRLQRKSLSNDQWSEQQKGAGFGLRLTYISVIIARIFLTV